MRSISREYEDSRFAKSSSDLMYECESACRRSLWGSYVIVSMVEAVDMSCIGEGRFVCGGEGGVENGKGLDWGRG